MTEILTTWVGGVVVVVGEGGGGKEDATNLLVEGVGDSDGGRCHRCHNYLSR